MLATTKYLLNRNYTGIEDIEELKNDFYKYRIVVSYDAELINGKRRLIFSSTKGMRSQKFDKITYECNGLILESGTWKPISIPCPTQKSSVNNNIVSKLIDNKKYDIYEVLNGTIVYLYYWNDMWNISTTRGLNMNNVKANKKTYLEMFNDILNQYDNTFQDFCNLLNKNTSYAFIIEHPNLHFHLDGTNKYNITFVHKAVINDDLTIYINRNSHELLLNIPYQKKVDLNINLKDIYSNLSKSLDQWKDNKKDPLYGYILFLNDKYTSGGDHSCLLLESNLMRNIRQFAYDRKYNEFGNDKENSVITHAFLGPNKKLFIELFPQYLDKYNKLEEVQNLLCQQIENQNEKSDNLEEKNNPIDKKIENNCIQYLIDEIKSKITLDKKNYIHIKPFINNVKYIQIYLKYL